MPGFIPRIEFLTSVPSQRLCKAMPVVRRGNSKDGSRSGCLILEDTPAQLDPIEAKQDWDAKTQ